MAKKQKHFAKEVPPSINEKKTVHTELPSEAHTAAIQGYESMKETLMPELEELVKKNPNRLIGCGG
ncbi:MAG: hypothetical protein U0T77_00875 [Chitinophagales bacterium]